MAKVYQTTIKGDITQEEAILKFLVNFSDEQNTGMISKD